jgi:hypothetical protein
VRTHDLAGQSIETRVSYDIISAADSSVRRYSDTYLSRYLHRFELEYLLEISGWRTISVFGTYDLDPFDASTERMIFLATWGEEHLIEQR